MPSNIIRGKMERRGADIEQKMEREERRERDRKKQRDDRLQVSRGYHNEYRGLWFGPRGKAFRSCERM